MRQIAILAALTTVVATTALCTPVSACGLEGGMGDALSAAHEGSLSVAFAAHDAVTSGWLSPDPELSKENAHERADERLHAFTNRLPAASRRAQPFAVLLVEPGVWTLISAKAGRWLPATHVEGPQAASTTLLASEPALRDLASGQLSANDALSRGVLAVHGEANARNQLEALLRQTYPDRSATTASR